MLSAGARLAFLPGVLAAAAAVCYLLPPDRRGAARAAAAVALTVTTVLLGLVVPAVVAGGTVIGDYGVAVPGVSLTLRADGPGVIIAAAGLIGAALSLAERRRRPREEAAILLCATGAVLAGLAGNAVLLFGAAEIGNVGALVLIAAARGRIGRGALMFFVVEHVAALALLLSAAYLDSLTGTTDPTALPLGALSAPLALPWAAAGAVRLLSLAISPGAADRRASRAWAATAAVPTGGAILLRLLQGSSGQLPTPVIVFLAGCGTLVALMGAGLAWRSVGSPAPAGRALLIAATGPVIAFAGIPGGGAGLAAGLVALELGVLAAPAWNLAGRSGVWGRRLGALALVSVGGLPIGLGTTALALGLGAVASLGKPYIAVVAALGTAAVIAAAAALTAAQHALAGSGDGEPVRVDAILAVGASIALSLLPGALAARLIAGLAGVPIDAPDVATIRGAGGGWPGGYISLAAILVGAAVIAVATLLGRHVPAASRLAPLGVPAPWLSLLGPRRRFGPIFGWAPRAVGAIDRWLVPQPQFGFLILGAVVAVLVLR